MGHKYKYKERCECGKLVKSNWERGSSSVKSKMLCHRIETHNYEATEREIKESNE